MQSAIHSELLHGTFRIFTAAHQFDIATRHQLLQLTLRAFSFNHHRDVSACLVLQQKLDVWVIHTRATGFGIGLPKRLGDGAVNLLCLAVMSYVKVIQECLEIFLDLLLNTCHLLIHPLDMLLQPFVDNCGNGHLTLGCHHFQRLLIAHRE